jgi:hypothetical protein
MTAMQIAHEIAQEYNLPCYITGARYAEIHHWPKKQHKKWVPEILYVTLFPLSAQAHDLDGGHISKTTLLHAAPTYPDAATQIEIAREHVNRCNKRGIRLIC